MKCLLPMLALVVALPASAVEWNEAKLSWDPVTTYTDFAVIADPVSYNVYAGRKGAGKALIMTTTATSVLRTSVPEGDWCWEVRAVVNGKEGAASVEGCKTIKKPASTTPAQAQNFKAE